MKIHPVAEAFPMLSGPLLAQLADSIKSVGQQHPIILLDGFILDGRCRFEACKLAKVEPKTAQYRGKKDTASLIAFVDAVNDKRRHLSTGQRAVAAHRLAKIMGAEKGKFTHAQVQAAQQLSVSESSAKQAGKVIEKGSPEVLAAVESGAVKVSDAKAIVELPKKQQAAALKKVQRGEAKTLRQAATEFDPEKFKPTKPGTQKRKPADRKAALLLFGKLVRALDKLGLSADLDTELKAINKALKES